MKSIQITIVEINVQTVFFKCHRNALEKRKNILEIGLTCYYVKMFCTVNVSKLYLCRETPVLSFAVIAPCLISYSS